MLRARIDTLLTCASLLFRAPVTKATVRCVFQVARWKQVEDMNTIMLVQPTSPTQLAFSLPATCSGIIAQILGLDLTYV